MIFPVRRCGAVLRQWWTVLSGKTWGTATPSRPESVVRFTYVDALRGIAALSVLVYHFTGSLIRNFPHNPLPKPIFSLLSHGNMGVEVFFVLSGFVISYTLRNAWVTPGYVGRFALRRSIRLDPPF